RAAEPAPNVHARAKRRSMEMYASERDGNSGLVDNKVYIIVSRSCEHPDVPQTKHAIRVMEYWSHMVVKTVQGSEKGQTDSKKDTGRTKGRLKKVHPRRPQPGMEFVLTYYDEPAVGGMPGGVAAWASGRAAPAYLARMRRAARDYCQWAAGAPRDRQEMPDFTPFDPGRVDERIEDVDEQISEQDMESSKDGPEMETSERTKDQSTQTDDLQFATVDVKEDEKEEKRGEKIEAATDRTENEDNNTTERMEPKAERNYVEVKSKEKSVEAVENKRYEEKNGVQAETVTNNCTETKETASCEGDENNGTWWRYLYPFYYFV
ncbi:unnamed protein product, partial [Iphiclides podalirius]